MAAIDLSPATLGADSILSGSDQVPDIGNKDLALDSNGQKAFTMSLDGSVTEIDLASGNRGPLLVFDNNDTQSIIYDADLHGHPMILTATHKLIALQSANTVDTFCIPPVFSMDTDGDAENTWVCLGYKHKL